MTEIEVVYTPLSEIESWPRNPKRHDTQRLTMSILEHGFNDPPAVDERTGRLVEGHGRIDALRKMKDDGEAPPVRIDVRTEDDEWLVPVLRGISFDTEEQAQAYLIAHNRITEKGGWDEQELHGMLQDMLEESEDVLAATSFSMEELDELTETVLGAVIASGGGETSPDDFKSIDPDEELDYCCPKCGYQWGGNPR